MTRTNIGAPPPAFTNGIDARLGQLISSSDALALLDALQAADRDVDCVEGFHMLADGRRQADLGLIFETSHLRQCSNYERCQFVRIFVANRSASDIFWEVEAPRA